MMTNKDEGQTRRGRPMKAGNDVNSFISLRLPKSQSFSLKALAALNQMELKDYLMIHLPKAMDLIEHLQSVAPDQLNLDKFWIRTKSVNKEVPDPVVPFAIQSTDELKSRISSFATRLGFKSQGYSISTTAMSLLTFLEHPENVIRSHDLIARSQKVVTVSWDFSLLEKAGVPNVITHYQISP